MEVTIPARQYAQTRFFYSRVLCLPIGKEGQHHAFFDTGGSFRLAVVDASKADSLSLPTGRGAFLNLSCDDLGSLRKRLEHGKVRILAENNDQFGQSITIRDPEGTTLNIFQDGSFG